MDMRKTLIVLNPVIEKMLGENSYKELINILETKGYLVDDSKRGLKAVKTEYARRVADNNLSPLIDARCPKVEELIQAEFPRLKGYLAQINPILIAGAFMAHDIAREKYPELQIDLIVISPCEAMKTYENMMWDTTILTWKDLKFLEDINLPETKLEVSPVMNFFRDFSERGFSVYEANGEEAVRNLLGNIPPDAKLLELLWGCGGCAAGDGL